MLNIRPFYLPVFALGLWALGAFQANGEVGPESLPQILNSAGSADVVRVVDGDTVVLSDRREVRLVGIQAPKLALGRPGFKSWPLSEIAKRELEAIGLDRGASLYTATTAVDRHGRTLAHMVVDGTDGTPSVWAQQHMLENGLARVYTFADNRALAEPLLAFEAVAREARLGIWANDFYAVRNVNNVGHDIDTFQLVEGLVMNAAKVGKRIYLNFGPVWRTDFTVLLSAGALKMFEQGGIDPLTWRGKWLRVRGWVKERNGPLIDVDHPERIEIVN